MPGDEKRFEQQGTEERGQGAEFVDTPDNEPGAQEQPAPQQDETPQAP
jgi:hypothetical protein